MNEEDTKVAEIFEKDINKLCEDINAVIEAHNKLVDEKVELENIIKEVREKLCKYGLVDKEGNFNAYLDTIELKELLEILDKENK